MVVISEYEQVALCIVQDVVVGVHGGGGGRDLILNTPRTKRLSPRTRSPRLSRQTPRPCAPPTPRPGREGTKRRQPRLKIRVVEHRLEMV